MSAPVREQDAALDARVVAYLVNLYPAVSHTFVRREIRALERRGWRVHRFSIRPGPASAPDVDDREEFARTTVLLRPARLVLDTVWTALASPLAFARAMRLAFRLRRRRRGSLSRHLAYLFEAASLGRFAKRLGISHVHCHFGTNAADVAMLASVIGPPSYSLTVHAVEFLHGHDAALDEKLSRARFAAAISHYARSQLMRLSRPLDWDRIHIVPCGLDDRFRSPVVEPTSTQQLAWIGRLAPEKGLPLLVDALSKLRLEGREFAVAIVGDGPLRDWLRSQVRERGLEQHVRLLGPLDAVSVARTLDEGFALVISSLSEGLPVVAMEAMARGRLVVAPRIAGIPELVTDEVGVLYRVGEVADLARAIGQALDLPEPTRRGMGELARQRAFERHDVDASAERMERLLAAASVTSARPPAPDSAPRRAPRGA